MTNISDGFLKRIGSEVKAIRSLQDGPSGPNNNGEPPGGDDMRARVQRLEDDMKEARGDLKVIRSDLAELKGRVSSLPGYGGIALIVGAIIGLSTIVQVLSRFIPVP